MKTAEPKPDDMEDIEVVLCPRETLLKAFTQGSLDISHGLVLNAFSHYLNLVGQDL